MSGPYTRYHPRWHRRRIPIFWWLGHAGYTRFIVRELTSVFVAYAAVLLTVETWMLRRGESAYAAFAAWLGSPVVVAVHVVVLAALLFHSVTWLALAPQALVVRIKGKTVPPTAVLLGHYAAWGVATAVIAWALVGR